MFGEREIHGVHQRGGRETAAEEGVSALRYLWARHRITAHLSDYNKLHSSDKRVKEVTGLGLIHNLLTAYTSFVAVDNQVRNTGDKPQTVNQPLPLPKAFPTMRSAAPA